MSVPAGWQSYDEGTERYWDGERWQGETRPVAPTGEATDPALIELRMLREQVRKIGSNVHIIGIIVVIWFILSVLVLFGLITVEFRPAL